MKFHQGIDCNYMLHALKLSQTALNKNRILEKSERKQSLTLRSSKVKNLSRFEKSLTSFSIKSSWINFFSQVLHGIFFIVHKCSSTLTKLIVTHIAKNVAVSCKKTSFTLSCRANRFTNINIRQERELLTKNVQFYFNISLPRDYSQISYQ